MFKIGDKVRVKKDLVGNTRYNWLYCSSTMADLKGNEYIIESVQEIAPGSLYTDDFDVIDDIFYTLMDSETIQTLPFSWNDQMIEKIED